MRFILPFFAAACLASFAGSAQKHTRNFQLPVSQITYAPSRYNSLEVLDLRADTTNLGTVQTGFLQGGRKTVLITEEPLAHQLKNLFQNLVSPHADTGKLLLSLRRFAFREQAFPSYNTGSVRLQAALFGQNSSGSYQMVNQTDTTLQYNYGGEGTDNLLKEGAFLLTNFLVQSLSLLSAGEASYTKAQLLNTDSLLKAGLPLFSTQPLSEGMYLTWEAFAQQQPDYQVKAQAGNGIVMNVKTTNARVNRRYGYEEMYALVHKGIPYIATEFGYCKLKKTGTDWIFTGKAREVASQGALLIGGLGGGLIGMAAAAGGTTALYEMKLDPADGRFVKLREVKGQ